MDISNKLFKNNRTGEVVRVIDSFDTIAILENRDKIDVRRLMDPTLFTEQIDPSTFFDNQNAYNTLAEKIKNIPTDKIPLDDEGSTMPVAIVDNGISMPVSNESAIIMMTEEDERAELAKKYGINDATDQVVKQNQAFAKLLGEEEIEGLPVVQSYPAEDVVQHIRVEDRNKQDDIHEPIRRIVEDPIVTMFKNIKRTKEFSINLEIKNKIPRSDFVEMMEDSYELSIIDFLSKEFTDNLLKNPDIIQNIIKEKIKEIVYGKKIAKPKQVKGKQITKKSVEKLPALKIEKELVLSKDLEKPARKPRQKKEIAE